MLQKKINRFIIFGQGRSGSTLLKQLLNSHRDINCEGELLNVKDNYVTNPFLIKLVNKFPYIFFSLRSLLSTRPVYGFTLLFYQIYQPIHILQRLQENGWKIIHITRKNALEQSLSQLVAKQTSFWHRREETKDQLPSVYINPLELSSWLEGLLANKKREQKIFDTIKHIEVIYENNLLDNSQWPETTRRLFEFLDVENLPVDANLRKTYNRPYSEIIENYEELIDEIEKRKLLTSLDEYI
ncbi:MAG: sulfotransferase [Bacteroidota bacterium]|nr:sulfotransferase [Bacteroidota bacterium]